MASLNCLNYNNGITYDMIEPNLYLSGEYEASDINALKKHKITHIVTINDFPLRPRIKETLTYINIKYIRLPDATSSDLLSYFDETYEFIRHGLMRGAVLVHCQMGLSRSATIVIAYLMKKYRIGYKEALEKVRAKRYVYPNPGFVSQLQKYKDLHFSTLNVFGPCSSRYLVR